jgi:hypothetical protein
MGDGGIWESKVMQKEETHGAHKYPDSTMERTTECKFLYYCILSIQQIMLSYTELVYIL